MRATIMTMKSCDLLLAAAFLLLFYGRADAFAFHSPTRSSTKKHTTLPLQMTTPNNNNDVEDSVQVVVFGVGDLRVDDHGGLRNALKHSNNKNNIQPVVLLDPSILKNIPGAACFTHDTACMLHHALLDLEQSLQSQLGLELNVMSSVDELLDGDARNENLHIDIHVCDLGPADNGMGYGPYSILKEAHKSNDNVEIHAWNCRLRQEPWNQLEHLTDVYPKYKQRYIDGQTPQLPTKILKQHDNNQESIVSRSQIPSIDTLVQLLTSTDTDNEMSDVKSQANTGLYATHWGGLHPNTVGESAVYKILEEYTDVCREVDALWTTAPTATRNPSSLEHAAMRWQSDNLIAGESMSRFLAAPLFWGTISPRRVWHASTLESKFQTSALKTMVETQEWHKLLAAHNLLLDEEYSNHKNGIQYKYWKWHGFLCRYAEYHPTGLDDDNDKDDVATRNNKKKKNALVLIHGFGASGFQWKGTMKALTQQSCTHHDVLLAPDLIGFGQSEKPPLSYTQYLWESYILAFCKEIGTDWESFVVGGNSIGGYTAMGVAASDAAVGETDVSSSGATGSKKCRGVVLMNSAGQIKSRDDIIDAKSDGSASTVAQMTASDALPKCSPPPRSVARTLGNGLLWYLRPRIQSICKNLYPINPDAVNDELCENILRDSLDPGAVNVMISGSKLPPPRTANELLGADYGASTKRGEGMFQGPVLVAQGMLDPLNDATMRAAMLGDLRNDITVSPLEAGHCPHDEVPSEVADAINKWIKVQSGTKVDSTKVPSNV